MMRDKKCRYRPPPITTNSFMLDCTSVVVDNDLELNFVTKAIVEIEIYAQEKWLELNSQKCNCK